ncbi:hypothetical protein [Streptomyces phaeolivaceus]|uniref:hypothetical protein n=1 Tax=Streptomyces phaeolivaceus TaxID=2653200 RepID=UPI001D050EED|nr:hypothetical protein [Streptomyces phaeolivaceus]
MDEMQTVWGMPEWLVWFGIGMAVLAIKAVAVAIVLIRNAKRQLPPVPPPGAVFIPPGAYPPGAYPPGAPGAYPPPNAPTNPKSGPND